MSMVASKAARVVSAADGKSVMEFGQRRTHPAAALDASWAAWVAGIQATSNVAAFARWGITTTGTMDHFAIQAAERPGRSRAETEREFFEAYARTFAGVPTTMLVDTYDTERGIRNAVEACPNGTSARSASTRTSRPSRSPARASCSPSSARRRRRSTSPTASTSIASPSCATLVDGFGVGENVVCSPDAAVGIGAVAKLVVNGYGATTMKVAHGTGKATLPGELQVWRFADHDLVALAQRAARPAATLARCSRRSGGAMPRCARLAPRADLAAARARAARRSPRSRADLRVARAANGAAAQARRLRRAWSREIERLVGEAR